MQVYEGTLSNHLHCKEELELFRKLFLSNRRNRRLSFPRLKTCAPLSVALVITISLFSAPVHAQFAYVANEGSNNVSAYTIDPSTGALTTIAGSPFPAARFPASVAVDPSGKFAYVAEEDSNNVSAYTIDPSTGALSANAGSPFPAGSAPSSVTISRSPLVPFAASTAKLEITSGGFDLNESFTLGANSSGINPVTENVILKIGTFSVTFPPGSFQQIAKGRFAFEGVINAVRFRSRRGATTCSPSWQRAEEWI